MRWLRKIIRWLFGNDMTGDIRLYIGDYVADLEKEPQFLYNWQLTDFTNPTVTKNSYSKSITLPSTKNNNQIFGHFWDFERRQEYGGNNGVFYNPTYRVPFTIYIDGNVFEKGYMKLEKVTRKDDGKYEFQVSLYGGLGNFLYNLQTDWNSGEKKTLADLTYYVEDTPLIEPGSNFTINKETVKEAWDEIDSYSSRWSVFNFAPCENGINEKLDSNKAIVNMNNMALFKDSVTEDGQTYGTVSGYTLATLPEKLLESEVYDYRSWAQRPVIRTKAIIDAISHKNNNRGKFDSGYEVVLDPEFFSSRNPYYEDSWMTLPMISSLTIKTEDDEETDYTASYAQAYTGTNYVELVYVLSHPVDKFGTTAELNFDLLVNVPSATSSSDYDEIYPSGVFWKGGGFSYDGQLKFTNVYALQGFATTDEIADKEAVDGTDVYWLQYNRTDRQTTLPYTYETARSLARMGVEPRTTSPYSPRFDTDICQVQEGHLVRYNDKVYRWNSQIVMSIPLPVGATSFRVRIDRIGNRNFNKSSLGDPLAFLFRDDYYNSQNSIIPNSVIPTAFVSNRVFKIKTGKLSNFYSGQEIKIKDIMNTPFSPSEFLLDYCRMFGLYIHKDLYDDKIYIDTRNTFFKRNQVEDISERIDYSKDMEITPVACESGYYRMKDKYAEGECYKDYDGKFGKIYGSKVINTGYEFDAETKDLISSNFKGGVQTRRNGKYYFHPLPVYDEDKQVWTYFHPYVFDGLEYNLYKGNVATGDTTDLSITKKVIVESFEPYDPAFPYYDLADKVEFCDKEKKALDGNYVLLFKTGDTDLSNQECYLTDDLDIMSRLNNNPCYILTDKETDKNNQQIAIALYSIPHFSRYWYSTTYFGSGSTRNNILYSMDYGSPRQLYLLNYTDYEQSNLYSQFYEKYYTDLYDVNTRVVTLYFHPKEILSNDSLRSFYWFSNCLWRLNRVIDYSPISNELVKCEFVKVQDLENMTNEVPSKELTLVVTLDRYSLDGSGGTIVATVHTSDYGPWSVEGWDYDDEITISPLSDRTDGTFNISVPSYYGANPRNVGITVAAGDISVTVYFTQTPIAGEQSISITAATPISSAATSLTYSVNAQPSGTVYLMSGATVLNQQSVSGSQTKSFAISANTSTSARTYTLSGVTADGTHSDVKNVIQNAATPEPPSEDYTIQYGDIFIDQDHSDLTGYSLTGGTITILNNNTTLKMVGVNGNENGLTLEGNTPWSASTSALTNCTINVDFGNLSWNQFLNPDVKVSVTINGDAVINMQYSQDGLSNGIPNVDLTQYASGNSIRLDVGVVFRTAL